MIPTNCDMETRIGGNSVSAPRIDVSWRGTRAAAERELPGRDRVRARRERNGTTTGPDRAVSGRTNASAGDANVIGARDRAVRRDMNAATDRMNVIG
jgi:hypothetical protein